MPAALIHGNGTGIEARQPAAWLRSTRRRARLSVSPALLLKITYTPNKAETSDKLRIPMGWTVPKWKKNRSRRRGRHNHRSIRRHFEWLALYQSGKSGKGYQAIANRVNRQSPRSGTGTQRATIWKAIQRLAKDLDIELKKRPPGRPKGLAKK
jgi:hypothetical protein